jgi:hypothetical protein
MVDDLLEQCQARTGEHHVVHIEKEIGNVHTTMKDE